MSLTNKKFYADNILYTYYMYKLMQVYKCTFLSLLMFCMPNGVKPMGFFYF